MGVDTSNFVNESQFTASQTITQPVRAWGIPIAIAAGFCIGWLGQTTAQRWLTIPTPQVIAVDAQADASHPVLRINTDQTIINQFESTPAALVSLVGLAATGAIVTGGMINAVSSVQNEE